MKEKVYKYAFITFVIINLITLYLFYDYFTEKPMLFSGLGIIINFCRLLGFGTGLGFILIVLRIIYHKRKNKNPFKTNFLYIFSGLFGMNLILNWVVSVCMGLIRLDSVLNLIVVALFIISNFIIIDIYKSNFKNNAK